MTLILICNFFILKENKPLKVLFRDAVFVYISVILGSMIVESFSSVDILKKAPEIFTNKPDF